MVATMERTAVKILEQVEESAQSCKVAQERDARGIKIGQVFRQGDLYIHRVHPGYSHGEKIQTRQLAAGTSKGSRHVAEEPAQCYAGNVHPASGAFSFSKVIGPHIISEAEFVISHPEHSDVRLPAGCYQVTHQGDALTQRRALD